MNCFCCSKTKKGCLFPEGSSSRNRCLHTSKLCTPWVLQCTSTLSVTILSTSNLPLPKELLTDIISSSPRGITDRVDGHIVVLCHRSSMDIVTNPTREAVNHLSSPPNKIIMNCLGNRWIPPQHLGNEKLAYKGRGQRMFILLLYTSVPLKIITKFISHRTHPLSAHSYLPSIIIKIHSSFLIMA